MRRRRRENNRNEEVEEEEEEEEEEGEGKQQKIRQPTRMLRQTRRPKTVFLIPVNQLKQL